MCRKQRKMRGRARYPFQILSASHHKIDFLPFYACCMNWVSSQWYSYKPACNKYKGCIIMHTTTSSSSSQLNYNLLIFWIRKHLLIFTFPSSKIPPSFLSYFGGIGCTSITTTFVTTAATTEFLPYSVVSSCNIFSFFSFPDSLVVRKECKERCLAADKWRKTETKTK